MQASNTFPPAGEAGALSSAEGLPRETVHAAHTVRRSRRLTARDPRVVATIAIGLMALYVTRVGIGLMALRTAATASRRACGLRIFPARQSSGPPCRASSRPRAS